MVEGKMLVSVWKQMKKFWNVREYIGEERCNGFFLKKLFNFSLIIFIHTQILKFLFNDFWVLVCFSWIQYHSETKLHVPSFLSKFVHKKICSHWCCWQLRLGLVSIGLGCSLQSSEETLKYWFLDSIPRDSGWIGLSVAWTQYFKTISQ